MQKVDAAAVYMDENIIILANGVVVSTSQFTVLKQLHLTKIKHVSKTTDHFVFLIENALYITNT